MPALRRLKLLGPSSKDLGQKRNLKRQALKALLLKLKLRTGQHPVHNSLVAETPDPFHPSRDEQRV